MLISIYYDGCCPICSASARILEDFDWFHKLRLINLHLPSVLEKAGIPKDKALERIHIQINELTIFEGIDALFRISLAVPAFWLFIPIIWMSKKTGLGNMLYDWVAKRRFLFPTPGYCKID
jgi:predicted DCC family thiol-disulfide oxidoreductase YuxK